MTRLSCIFNAMESYGLSHEQLLIYIFHKEPEWYNLFMVTFLFGVRYITVIDEFMWVVHSYSSWLFQWLPYDYPSAS